MKIGIDARRFIDKNYTGISRSVYEIIKVWVEKHPEHEYFLLSHLPIQLDFELPDNWHVIVKPFPINKGVLWEACVLPGLIKKYELDKYWGTNYTTPRSIKGVDYYVTIYDLAALKFDDIGTTKIRTRLGYNAKKACNDSKAIIAISEASKKDVIEIFGIESDKIVVSYCGGMPTNYHVYVPDISRVNESLVFDEDFFLFIGTIEPRKNIKTIIKGFEAYIDKSRGNEKLVLAGKRGWNCDDIYLQVENSKYRDRIVMPGFISDDDKAYLLSKAKIFLYPSLYEGFGIPVLEAFTYNLPIITTRISSLPEVGGDAAYYIENAEDYIELSEKIENVYSRTENEVRLQAEKMQFQASKFSWEKNADEVLSVICRQ